MMRHDSLATSNPEESEGIHEAIASLARRSAPGTLLGAECVGLLGILAVIAWLPDRATLGLPLVAISSFGLWGIADRAQQNSGTRRTRSAISFFQLLIAAAGGAAVIALIFAAGGRLIGTVVS